MGLASSITKEFGFSGTLEEFFKTRKDLKVLEINTAGNLTEFFKKNPLHLLIQYPQYNLLNLDIESASFDLVVHSDTLEHIPNPERALSECHRILKNNGTCIFTVPIIVDRMTRSRSGLSASYHGQSTVNAEDQIVCTEFGADIWKTVLKAGFYSCEICAIEYPAALVIVARK